MTEPAVQVIEVEKRFHRTRAVAGVTFDAGPGITGLLGPNGAGKTTLLRILATVLAPDSGAVRLLGRDPGRSEDRIPIRRRLGYMPQEPGYHRNFPAFDFVDYVAILKEMTDRRPRHAEVRRVLELVDLGNVASTRIKALSGGMRRRVALAQSLLGDPALLVLDEPTAGLDPQQRLRVLVMDEGQILFDGAPHQLAEMARGRVWIADERDARARLSWRTGEGRHRHIGDAPADAELVEPSIEDAYLLLVGHRAIEEETAA